MAELPENTTPQSNPSPEPATPEPTDQGVWDKPMPRRKILKGAVVGAATIATGGGILAAGKAIADFIAPPLTPDKIPQQPTLEPANPTEQPSGANPSPVPEKTTSPENLTSGIEFGFNTHLDNEAANMNLDLFKKCVEDLSSRGQSWIRFNLQGYNTSSPNIMSDIDQGLSYAKGKGLKVAFVVTDPPDPNNTASISDFYSGLAERFKGKVNVWQIFNEPNTHDFRNYKGIPKAEGDYLRILSEAVAAASAGIKRADPDAKTTVSMSAPQNRDVVNEGLEFFGSLKDSVDIITLDLYPEGNEQLMAKYPDYVASLNQSLGKDIMVGEIGWPTFENGFTPQDQARYMEKVMSAFQGGSVKPTAVLFYEWADEEGVGENAFGANKTDGTPKDSGSYEQLIQTMTPPKTTSDVPTPPQVI